MARDPSKKKERDVGVVEIGFQREFSHVSSCSCSAFTHATSAGGRHVRVCVREGSKRKARGKLGDVRAILKVNQACPNTM